MSDSPNPLQRAREAEVRFTVLGRPVPKGRPRVVSTGAGRTHTFTPKRTKAAEAVIGALALVARQAGARRAFSGHVGVSLVFWVAPSRRVDVDNLAKTVLDACNGVLWDDDSQVSALNVCRIYGSPERTDVFVKEMAPLDAKTEGR